MSERLRRNRGGKRREAVIDLEIGDWLIVDSFRARRITGLEVHAKRGDGLHDGQVRILMGEITLVYDEDHLVFMLKE